MITALEFRKAVQALLGVAPDGAIGPHSLAALHNLINTPDDAPWPASAQGDGIREGWATSFADPEDVAAFRDCKDEGFTDEHCFTLGDDGIGKWGDDCSAGSGPKCALPPEDWEQKANPRGARVRVSVGPRSIICELADTMPHKKNITNGAVIDLNPDACAALGLKPPVKVRASWEWV